MQEFYELQIIVISMKLKFFLIVGIIFLGALVSMLIYFFEDQSIEQEDVQSTSLDINQNTVVSQNNIANVREAETSLLLQHDAFIKDNPGTFKFKSFEYNTRPIPVSLAQTALSFGVSDTISTYLNQENWGIYECEGLSTSPTYVLLLNNSVLTDYQGDIFLDTQERMKVWEEDILIDTQSILFPRLYYDVDLFRSGDFLLVDSDYGLRESVVSDSDGVEYELSYAIFGDHLLTGNNSECLIEIGNSLVELVI